MVKKLGIIAGNGSLPSEIANIYLKKSGHSAIIAALEKEADLALISDFSYQVFPIGSAGKIIEYFQDNNVQDIILIGGVKRPDLKSIKLDLVGSKLMAKILKEKLLGDDSVLRVIAKFLSAEGFNLIPASDILAHNDYSNIFATTKLSAQDKIDIEIGKKLLLALGNHDTGQAVIVENGYVLGIEAAEGTDNLIKRCGLLRKKDKGGALVKMPKISQDLRLDLPTIGPDTIMLLHQNHFNCLAIAKGVLIARPKETADLLKKYRIRMVFV